MRGGEKGRKRREIGRMKREEGQEKGGGGEREINIEAGERGRKYVTHWDLMRMKYIFWSRGNCPGHQTSLQGM